MNIWKNKSAAWPVANPVITCASLSNAGFPSNFVADPFLYIQVILTVLYLSYLIAIAFQFSLKHLFVVLFKNLSRICQVYSYEILFQIMYT